MEHVTKIPETGNQVKLVAERGYLLKSKVSGKTYQEISTCDMKRWEVIEDPDYVKPESKAVVKTPQECTETTEPKTVSKPQTQKRKSSKSKR